MLKRQKVPVKLCERVRERACYLCEYCHASEKWQYVRFTIEHVSPIVSGGQGEYQNLALACFHCNRRKHIHVSAIDPQTGKDVPLFNPREDSWREHFNWSEDKRFIIGLRAIGRATISLLNMNRPRILDIRSVDASMHRHPPDGDPIQS